MDNRAGAGLNPNPPVRFDQYHFPRTEWDRSLLLSVSPLHVHSSVAHEDEQSKDKRLTTFFKNKTYKFLFQYKIISSQ